jgi:16S rRNA (cytidine1402-2'-O)-methyltransferase
MTAPSRTPPSPAAAAGRLLLIPNALDLGTDVVPLADVLPHGAITTAARLSHWVVEDARSARAFLKRVDALVPLAQPLQATRIVELPRPPKGGGAHAGTPPDARAAHDALLAPTREGHDLGLLSEAGLPGVADPGALLVAAAHARGLVVLPLSGPSSLTLALAASGLNGQSFVFHGYLPSEGPARAARLRELEATSRRLRQTQLFIETPYRNAAMLGALLQALQPTTRLSISCGLTLPQGWTACRPVAEWRRAPVEMPDRIPAVFCLLAE